MSDFVITRDEGPVRLVTINRPEKKNALTRDMYDGLTHALTQNQDGVRAIIITGHETIFSAGNDIGDFLAAPPHPDNPDTPVWRFLRAIAECPIPLIAGVRGPAVGVGLTMLLHCDLVYAGQTATFSAPFAKLGLAPEAASSLLLPQAIGRAKANALLLLGETFSADQAERAGLVTAVVPDGRVEDECLARAQAIAGLPERGVLEAKRLIRLSDHDTVMAHMMTEGRVFAELLQSPQFREFAEAFLAQRPAKV